MRDFHTKDAVELAVRMVNGFLKGGDDPSLNWEELELGIIKIFEKPPNGVHIVERLDLFVDKHEGIDLIREYLVDLASLKVMSDDETEPDEIDPEFEERGSEMIMMLLYIRDCFISEIPPSLPDFLYNFVLDEDESTQEAFEFYEEFIRYQDIVNNLDAIIDRGNEIEGNPGELFTPIFAYFYGLQHGFEGIVEAIKKDSNLPDLHLGIFETMHHFYKWNKAAIK